MMAVDMSGCTLHVLVPRICQVDIPDVSLIVVDMSGYIPDVSMKILDMSGM